VYERRGEEDAALDAYEESVRRDPDGSLADDAAWWRARLLEDMDRRQSAIAAYREFPGQHPGSPWVTEAFFRSGLLLLVEEQPEEALAAFGRARSTADDPDGRDRARLWQAKALSAAGRPGEAGVILEELAGDNPGGYYGLRAAALLGRPAPSVEPARRTTDEPAIDWAAIDAWAGSWLPATPQPVVWPS
jgi:tetratricopeptide (TPR) repeat protein